MVDHGIQANQENNKEETGAMTDDEIMDMDMMRSAKSDGKCWSQDHGWVECCKVCWYPINECACETKEQ